MTNTLTYEQWNEIAYADQWMHYSTMVKLNKQLAKKIRLLEEDNAELRRKCKEHFENAQNMMRYEFKLPDGYDFESAQVNRTIVAKVEGRDVTWQFPQ